MRGAGLVSIGALDGNDGSNLNMTGLRPINYATSFDASFIMNDPLKVLPDRSAQLSPFL